MNYNVKGLFIIFRIICKDGKLVYKKVEFNVYD